MFTVVLKDAYCTGCPDWRGKSFSGIGMSRSLQKAVKKAFQSLEAHLRSDVEMASQIPVYSEYSIMRGTILIKQGNYFSDLV